MDLTLQYSVQNSPSKVPRRSLQSIMDLVKLIQKLPFAPPLFNEAIMDKFGARVAIPHTTFPKGKCTEMKAQLKSTHNIFRRYCQKMPIINTLRNIA